MTKIETSKINHEVVIVTRSKTSESQQEVQPRSFTEEKSCQPVNNPELRATPEHLTLSAATWLQVSSSSQSSPHVRCSPACLLDNPRLRANSGNKDGRSFNNRGGERGQQPISFRSCVKDSEHTEEKVAQVASAPPGPLVRCEDEAYGDQAERWTKTEQGGADTGTSGSFVGRPC